MLNHFFKIAFVAAMFSLPVACATKTKTTSSGSSTMMQTEKISQEAKLSADKAASDARAAKETADKAASDARAAKAIAEEALRKASEADASVDRAFQKSQEK